MGWMKCSIICLIITLLILLSSAITEARHFRSIRIAREALEAQFEREKMNVAATNDWPDRMAISRPSILSLVLTVLLLFSNMSSSYGVSFRGIENMQRRMNSKQHLLKLSVSFSPRAVVNVERLPPDGPDPEHH
nr:CLAVATA3/ESR (CLE)-related protein 6-like [Ipomoea batatas]